MHFWNSIRILLFVMFPFFAYGVDSTLLELKGHIDRDKVNTAIERLSTSSGTLGIVVKFSSGDLPAVLALHCLIVDI